MAKKKEAPQIETERLILRKREKEDIPNMFKMFDNNEVREFLGGYPPRDEHTMLKIVIGRKETEWAVILKGSNEYIGECLVPTIVDNYLGEIGYLFLREHWGNGYAHEAVSAIIEYCFETLNLKRLYATIDNKNERSKKLIEKLGFELIAMLLEANFGGRVADVAYYARTK
jgi:RimJ/RimL family protein N-acetyltransferase